MSIDLLAYDFVQRGFAASGIVAVVAGTVGYFLVLRGQTFAGHALSHVGFAGATGAALIGLPPLGGMVAFTVGAGVGMGLLGERLSGRDVAIGIVLALALGFGFLFLNLHSTNAAQATTLLFGNVLAVSSAMLWNLVLLGLATLVALALISRPLLFSSLQPELAEAKGVSARLTGVLFMIVVALAVAQSVQIVGVLLVFALMVGPPAAAQLLTARLLPGVLLAAGLAVSQAWLGIVIAFHADWPTSFCITALGALVYLAALWTSRR
jgi:zinc/manganese transport system permease protein